MFRNRSFARVGPHESPNAKSKHGPTQDAAPQRERVPLAALVPDPNWGDQRSAADETGVNAPPCSPDLRQHQHQSLGNGLSTTALVGIAAPPSPSPAHENDGAAVALMGDAVGSDVTVGSHGQGMSSPGPSEEQDVAALQRWKLECLLDPSLLSFLRFQDAGSLPSVSHGMRQLCEDETYAPGLWHSMCESLSREHALYLPDQPPGLKDGQASMAWKRYFFDGLWPARSKWTLERSQAESYDFKISVCVRFRPETQRPEDAKLSLPLHQFIKLQRTRARLQDASSSSGATSKPVTVGQDCPKRFMDAVFGTIMRDPVKLPSSGAVVDRSAAAAFIARHHKDMVDHTALRSVDDLLPCTELKKEIQDWKRQQASSFVDIDRVQRSEVVRNIVDQEIALPPELIEALCEADRLDAIGKSAEAEAHRLGSEGTQRPGETADREMQLEEHGAGDAAAGGAEDEPATVVASAQSATAGLEGEELSLKSMPSDSTSLEDLLVRGARVDDEDDYDETMSIAALGRMRRRKEGPRVLGLQETQVMMFVPGQGVRPFPFARVLDSSVDQASIFSQCARGAVTSVLNGFNACLLCYGQTGSGKTHTAFGPEKALEGATAVNENSGVVLRALGEVVSAARIMAEEHRVSTRLSAQYVEIYNDKITDLLTGEPCDVRRNGGALTGALECTFESLEDAIRLLRAGQVRKRFAATAMNERSSRAHTVFVLHVRQSYTRATARDNSGADGQQQEENDAAMVSTTLHMVDLAGSERIKKSKAVGHVRDEAVGINESLMKLGKVISALVEGKSHVPYLECKLTTLLQGALGGASRTTAVVCCRKDDDQAGETLQALRFGERCAMVKNSTYSSAVTSAAGALRTIDDSLEKSRKQLESLRQRGKSHLPAFRSLQERIEQLAQRRRAIADVARSHI